MSGATSSTEAAPRAGNKPASEIVTAEVSPLIDQATFDALQAHLRASNPKVTPARVVSGPTLLTGICFCADCGGAMTLRTGKGGRYRYYTCSIKARQGETGCKGRSIPMEKLDNLVADHIEDRLLQPERLEEVLASVLDRRQERAERRREHIAGLHQRAAEADLRLKRLYDAIESGVADLDDPALKDRIAGLKAIRDQAQAEAERTAAALESTANKPSRRRWCGSSPRRRASGYGLPAAATAATTSAHSPSASRSRMARSASSDRRAICFRRSPPPRASASHVRSSQFCSEWRPLPDSNRCCRRERADRSVRVANIGRPRQWILQLVGTCYAPNELLQGGNRDFLQSFTGAGRPKFDGRKLGGLASAQPEGHE